MRNRLVPAAAVLIPVLLAGAAIAARGQNSATPLAPGQGASSSPKTGQAGTGKTLEAKPSLQEIANQMAELYEQWGPSLGSPIGSISLKDIGQQGTLHSYHLYAVGLPPNILYKVVAWPVTASAPVDVVRGVALDAVGMAICPGQLGTCGTVTHPNEPATLSATVAPGRPVRVGLVAMDGSANKAFVKFVPQPVKGTDKQCTVEAITLTPNFEIALIEGSGFPPMSPVTMNLVNGDVKNSGKTPADAQGEFAATVIPLKDGVTNGLMKLDFTAAACHPAVSFEWGRPAPATAAPAGAAPAGDPKAPAAADPKAPAAADPGPFQPAFPAPPGK